MHNLAQIRGYMSSVNSSASAADPICDTCGMHHAGNQSCDPSTLAMLANEYKWQKDEAERSRIVSPTAEEDPVGERTPDGIPDVCMDMHTDDFDRREFLDRQKELDDLVDYPGDDHPDAVLFDKDATDPGHGDSQDAQDLP